MRRLQFRIVLIVILLGLSLGSAPAAAPSTSRAAADADSLYRRALERFQQEDPEQSRLALGDLEQAMRTAGRRVDVLNAIARTYSAMGFLSEAQECLDRIARVTPDDAESQIQLGVLWKWEWLASL